MIFKANEKSKDHNDFIGNFFTILRIIFNMLGGDYFRLQLHLIPGYAYAQQLNIIKNIQLK